MTNSPVWPQTESRLHRRGKLFRSPGDLSCTPPETTTTTSLTPVSREDPARSGPPARTPPTPGRNPAAVKPHSGWSWVARNPDELQSGWQGIRNPLRSDLPTIRSPSVLTRSDVDPTRCVRPATPLRAKAGGLTIARETRPVGTPAVSPRWRPRRTGHTTPTFRRLSRTQVGPNTSRHSSRHVRRPTGSVSFFPIRATDRPPLRKLPRTRDEFGSTIDPQRVIDPQRAIDTQPARLTSTGGVGLKGRLNQPRAKPWVRRANAERPCRGRSRCRMRGFRVGNQPRVNGVGKCSAVATTGARWPHEFPGFSDDHSPANRANGSP